MEDSRANKENLISELSAYALGEVQGSQQAALLNFIEHYIFCIYCDDLVKQDTAELFSSIMSFWSLVNSTYEDIAINIYNPEFEIHGFSSNNTIIEISSKLTPFLISSIRMELQNRKIPVLSFYDLGQIKVSRNIDGKIEKVFSNDYEGSYESENPLYIEIEKQNSKEVIERIEDNIRKVAKIVFQAVTDYDKVLAKLREVNSSFSDSKYGNNNKVLEVINFLNWLSEDNFTFLAYNKLSFNNRNYYANQDCSLGIFKDRIKDLSINLDDIPEDAKDVINNDDIYLLIAKHPEKSKVHRSSYMDKIIIKEVLDNGEMILHQFSGLYTSVVYNTDIAKIPILSSKLSSYLEEKGYTYSSHEAKSVIHILNNLSKDDLFQASIGLIGSWIDAINHMNQSQKISLLLKRDLFGHYFSCLVFVPREKFGTEIRLKIQKVLYDYFKSSDLHYSVNFSDPQFNRIDFVIRIDRDNTFNPDVKYLSERVVELAKTWEDTFAEVVVEHHGDELGNDLLHKYVESFGSGYKEYFSPKSALYDMAHLESIDGSKTTSISLHKTTKGLQLKLFKLNELLPLSDTIPMLENLGLRVVSQNLYEIKLRNNIVYLNSFNVELNISNQLYKDNFKLEDSKDIFLATLKNILYGNCENDSFNKLALACNFNYRQIDIFRAYAKYMWQIGVQFSLTYIEDTLVNNYAITQMLFEMFEARFDPHDGNLDKHSKFKLIERAIDATLDKVDSLDEDKILRKYKDLILATLRTNFYQTVEKKKPSDTGYKDYISFKISPKEVPDMPLPLPEYEIFVYSPKVEGVHLRGGKVARGGLRWSDRKEDYRTEILGLVKAQLVKNAVIVPTGAKGGFVCKELNKEMNREQVFDEVRHCYTSFISGLLDLTDNLVNKQVIHPENTLIYDDSDTYLVVAADKGTATFSDLANDISNKYNFWLKDAFASGGSNGYDHKKMGITAAGAWESAKRSFSELDVDIQSTDFTVVGIGDMSGDVFGNGMLLSKHIHLVAAFNHMHIFIDPNPDSSTGYVERKRLFELPRSTWQDYNKELISKGGGVFSRTLKYIRLTDEMKDMFGLEQDTITPVDLIKKILTLKVDLLFNGGIGTYVKSAKERNNDVGDKTNDVLRVNGRDLKCKVVCEGGNLGLTQLGRVEYALSGGKINTDSIDNSAGVDCSDNEVNIKILLNHILEDGDLTQKQRNALLEEMTDEVSSLVIKDNIDQSLAISLANAYSSVNVTLHSRLIEVWQQSGKLNPELEFLPTTEELVERGKHGSGLTRPELSILLAYGKILLKEELLKVDFTDDKYLNNYLLKSFPKQLYSTYSKQILEHPLRVEILATKLSNILINEVGISFIYRLQEETTSSIEDILKCFLIAREIFSTGELFAKIESSRLELSDKVQYKMLHEIVRLTRRVTRWLLKYSNGNINIENFIEAFKEKIKEIFVLLPKITKGATNRFIESEDNELKNNNVCPEVSRKIAGMPWMVSALDIIDLANMYDCSLEQVAKVYYNLGYKLKLGWLRNVVKKHAVKDHWDAMASSSIRDDIDLYHRSLTIGILLELKDKNIEEYDFDNDLIKDHPVVKRWYEIIDSIKSKPSNDFIMYAVSIRELSNLTGMIFDKKK